jgi:transcriptional regulator with XRE-family HTH domain
MTEIDLIGTGFTPMRKASMDRQKQLAKFVAEERRAHKIPQSEVARKLRQYQSRISRLESGTHRIDVCEFLDLAAAIGFSPSAILEKIQGVAPNGNRIDEALAIVKAAGYRVSKLKPKKDKGRVGPAFAATFSDGTQTRMSVSTALDKLDWERGVRLSQAAYQSRCRTHVLPLPPIIAAHFEQDGKVLATYPNEESGS